MPPASPTGRISRPTRPDAREAAIAAGAKGITCQKIGEAEVMADAGIDDILDQLQLIGDEKMRGSRAAGQGNMTVARRYSVVIAGLPQAAAARAGRSRVVGAIPGANVRVETLQKPSRSRAKLPRSKGRTFAGFMLYPTESGWTEAQKFFDEAWLACARSGLRRPWSQPAHAKSKKCRQTQGRTEHRPAPTFTMTGSSRGRRRILDDARWKHLFDRGQPRRPGIANLDAGRKTLTSDTGGGLAAMDHSRNPEARIARFAEEHGF